MSKPDQESARPAWLDDRVLKGGLWACLALCLATELGLRLAAPALWRDPAVTEAVSVPLLQDRLDALAASSRPAVIFLGDSISYGSALREHGVAGWRRKTPPADLRRRLAAQGWDVDSFAFDGAFPLDLEALFDAAVSSLPQAKAVVLQLNYRMLSADAGGMARPFLARWSPDPPAAPGPAWVDAAALRLRQGWAAYRYAELASYCAFQPSLGALLQRQAARVFPPQEQDSDMADALLDLKIRPDYQAPAPAPAHKGWQALRRLAVELPKGGRKVFVFLSPQNLDRVEGLLDPEAWKANRAALKALFGSAPGIVYRDWAQRPPAGAFLDHCHLDPEGNEALAGWIAEELRP